MVLQQHGLRPGPGRALCAVHPVASKCGLSFNTLALITSDYVSFMCLIYMDCPSTCWP